MTLTYLLDPAAAGGEHWLTLVAMVIVVAWIWEDAALVSAALLAAENRFSVPVAVLAVFVGIASGDLALYYLGRLACRWRWLRARLLRRSRSRALSRRFRRSTVANIFFIRFIPGLRTLGFTLCGLWRIALARFLGAMMLAGALWIALVFTLVYQLGASAWLVHSQWKWALMGIALCLLVFNNLRMQRAMKVATK